MSEIKSVDVADLEIGKAYHVARRTNAHGQPVVGTRKSDWKAVLLTSENIASYADGQGGTYYFQPIKDRHTPRLLAAGWYRFPYSQGMCGAAITTPGPLHGLACERSAYWRLGAGPAMCAQHAVQYL